MQVNVKKGVTQIRLTVPEKRQLVTAYELCEALAKNGRCKAAWKAFDALKALLAEFGALPTVAEEEDEKSPTA